MNQKEQLEGMFKRLEGKSEDEQRAAVKAFSPEEQELLKVNADESYLFHLSTLFLPEESYALSARCAQRWRSFRPTASLWGVQQVASSQISLFFFPKWQISEGGRGEKKGCWHCSSQSASRTGPPRLQNVCQLPLAVVSHAEVGAF